MSIPTSSPLPEWQTCAWFNTPGPLQLADLRGRVVALYAFQLLCPACRQHALPQAARLADSYDPAALAVVALHTVFEAHQRQDAAALAAFLAESGYTFPVGIDTPGPLWLPKTMESYGIEGTPSLLLIDRRGRRRLRRLGHINDYLLIPQLDALLAESLSAADGA